MSSRGNGLTTEERRAKSLAAWERARAEGRVGWTEERRAKFKATLAAKYPKSNHAAAVRLSLIGPEIDAMRAEISSLVARVAELESRPSGPAQVRIVEWKPDHRRIKDGGQPVRLQRRAVGLPKHPKAAVA